MKTFSGIDVSEHNGTIDWKKVKPHISFAMIRAGYGSKTLDTKFKENATNCTINRIPFGVYWFSYAYNASMAKKEAKACINAVKPYVLSCPIAFDFEYDSVSYAKRNGVVITPALMREIADAFLGEIINAGYECLLYTNVDFWNRGFKEFGNKYPIWCANWGTEKPALYCKIWQDSATGKIEGIPGQVDTDISYQEWKIPTTDAERLEKISEVINKYAQKYRGIAEDIINGKYGNGNERKAKLIANQLDPNYAQDMVNALIGD